MALIVQKYGGTSVANVERIQAVAQRVQRYRQQGDDVVVVVSAMSGETNRLINLISQIDVNAPCREKDVILSTGEQVTMALLSMALTKRDCPAISYTGSQVKILTDSAHSKARIVDIDDHNIQSQLQAG
jgi:aspartate kinase